MSINPDDIRRERVAVTAAITEAAGFSAADAATILALQDDVAALQAGEMSALNVDGGKVRTEPHSDDLTPNGTLIVYSRIAADQDLALYSDHDHGDVHIWGRPGNDGEFHIDIPIRITSAEQPDGLEVRQNDSAPVIRFPATGGEIDVYAVLRGGNGGDDDLAVRIGSATGNFKVLNAANTIVAFNVSDAGVVNAASSVWGASGTAQATKIGNSAGYGSVVFEGPGITIFGGADAPEGVVTANPGSLYLRTNGTMYLKTSGTGNTGWTLK